LHVTKRPATTSDTTDKIKEEVKGIGAKTAAAIVLYREAHGAFSSLDDLVKVKGIGARTLEKIRPYPSVGKSMSMQAVSRSIA